MVYEEVRLETSLDLCDGLTFRRQGSVSLSLDVTKMIGLWLIFSKCISKILQCENRRQMLPLLPNDTMPMLSLRLSLHMLIMYDYSQYTNFCCLRLVVALDIFDC
jgi:hypothetical protein